MIRKSMALRFQYNGVTLFSIFVFYTVVHSFLRLSFSGNFTTDDAGSALYAVTLKWAYSIYQPPLYEWVLWFFQRLFGFHLLANLATKYLFLGGGAFFIYQAAKIVFDNNKRIAFLSTLSFLLFYQIGWNLLEGATQTSAVIFASSFTLWAVLMIIQDNKKFSYVFFTLASFLGVMAKFSFPIFWLAIMLSLLAIKHLRQNINWLWFFCAAFFALLFSSPYFINAVFLGGFWEGIYNKMSQKTQGVAFVGGIKILRGYLLYSLAFLPVFLGCFYKVISLKQAQKFFNENQKVRFICLVFLLCFLILFSGSVLFGFDNIKERHLHPFFLVLPMASFIFLNNDAMVFSLSRLYLFIIGVVVFGVLLVKFVVLAVPIEQVCGRCRETIPYASLSVELEKYQPFETLIVDDVYLAANLSRFVEPSKIVIGYSNKSCALVISAKKKWVEKFSEDILPVHMNWQSFGARGRKAKWFLADLRVGDKNFSCEKPES